MVQRIRFQKPPLPVNDGHDTTEKEVTEQVHLTRARTEAEARIAREKATKKASGQPFQRGNSPQAAVAAYRPNPPASQGVAMRRRRRSSTNKSYEVGFRKPPKVSQFRKGESGNKSGRPKGSKNVTTLLMEALGKEVIVTENGRRRRLTKRELMFDVLANKCIAGDLRAVAIALERLDAAESRRGSEQTGGLDEADREVAQTLITRLRKPPTEEENE